MNSMIPSCINESRKTFQSLLKSYYRSFLAITAAAVIVWACEEQPSEIGSGLLPGTDFATVFSSDTFTINAYTMYDDSVRATDSIYLLGRRYNPYFGTTTAELVSQLNLLTPWKGQDFIIDSVSLILTIRYYEGDTIFDDQYIEVYEISEYLYKDTIYYSNKPVQVLRDLGTFPLFGIEADTSLEIRVPDWIGYHLMRDTTKLFISSTTPDFRDFFRGVYMRLAPNPNNAFFSLSTEFASSGFQVYWHNASESNRAYSFVLSDKSARYKRIIHDFTTAEAGKEINHINDYVKDTLVYMQKLNGVYTRLEIPGLEQLRQFLPASVSKARLIMPVQLDNDIFTDATVAGNLYLRYTDGSGNKVFVPDSYLGRAYFGGSYLKDNDHYYFNLASFVQEYLEGRIPDPVIEIYMPQGADIDLILKANEASVKPRFELTMTKF